MKIVLASNNPGKLREIREILCGTDIEVISQKEAGCSVDPEENGATFRENALIKARAVVEATGLPAMSDDSGLEVNAMDNGPGIFSARYGDGLPYEIKNKMIIDNVGTNPDRGARFVCAAVCAFPNGDAVYADGVIEGNIAHEARGEGGFGYDPIFVPVGYTQTTAEIPQEEKNKISHRGKAFRKLAEELKNYIDNNKE